MKTLILTALSAAAAVALAPTLAAAQAAPPPPPGTGFNLMNPTFYGTLGYDDTSRDHQDLSSIQLRLGARFSRYFGIEGEGSWGLGDDKVHIIDAPPIKVHQDSQEAIYGVGFLPIMPNFDLLARIGYGHSTGTGPVAGVTNLSGTGPLQGVTNGVRGDSWNFGVGGQYMFDPKNGVRLDYTREDFQPRGVSDANVYAISYVRKF